jgi:hypothetical protein
MNDKTGMTRTSGSARATGWRRRFALFCPALLVAAVACSDYAHTNPYDPATEVAIQISGPDTLFSSSELGTFSAQSIPAFPDSAFQWASSDSTVFFPSGIATFRSSAPPLYPLTQTVTVSALVGQQDTTEQENIGGANILINTYVWRHAAYTQVVLTQRVTHIQLRCPDTHACAPVPADSSWSVWVDGFDALNHGIVGLTTTTVNPLTGIAVATFTVRDTTVASVLPVGIRAANVTAKKTGTTWIVATRGALLDSLQLVVQ